MTPLFWRCEYAALVGGGTQVVGIETDGVLSQNICAEKHPDAHKSLILYQPSDTKIYVPGKATFGGIWTWPVSDDHFSVVKKSIDGFLQEFESIPVEVHMPPD